ncbi:murein hydrolase activator EnvC family protein [Abyssibacter profundi]|uniref:murein hydrolase activator EnvC family protein n=1 Tax=Abyssibacter profundi TaxID=2182787 RepID=UPI00140218A2|nr:peptidoglycan DD-metalloendopeptidase family protein [Abyssibacter profundi]
MQSTGLSHSPASGRRPALGCRRLLVVLLGACLLLSMPASRAQDDDRMAENAAELERVRARLQALKKEVDRDRSRRGQLFAELEATETRIGELASTMRALQSDIDSEQTRMQATRRDRDAALGDMEREREALKHQIRAAYQIGRQGRTKLLLNQEDPAAIGRVLTYYDYLAKARSQRIQAFAEAARTLRGLESRLAQEIKSLEALYAKRKRSLEALESTRTQRETAVANLEAKIRDSVLQVRQLEADEAQLTDLLASLKDVLADIPLNLDDDQPITQRRGAVDWPVRGRLLAGFGQPKAGNIRWKGLWIAAEEGTPVQAVASGRVAYVGWMHRYGVLVILEHDDDWYSLYGHNQTAFVQVGEWVRQGESVGAAGNSGGHRNSGLYFELRKGQRPVDPIRWLAAR